MAKKLLVFGLILALTAALVGPAAAGKKKKKKKGPKPYVSDTVTVDIGHPAFFATAGTPVLITAQDFLRSCSVPSTNGLDAYVFEVPEDYQKIPALVKAIGDSAPAVEYDLDMFLYDAECTNTGAFQAVGTDEVGVMNAGTAFVMVHNYTGDPVDLHIELSPSK